jgi:uncharacterized tellurite resistance protein B-like protein
VTPDDADWLWTLLDQAPPPPPTSRPLTPLGQLRSARRHLALWLSDLDRHELPRAGADDAQRFLVFCRGLVRLGDDLLVRTRPEPRLLQLTGALLALAGEESAALDLLKPGAAPTPRGLRLALRPAARWLRAQQESLLSDPVYGVPLHAGLAAGTAWTFGRLVLLVASPAGLGRAALRRRRHQGQREKAALVAALVQLVWARRPPHDEERRALKRQVAGLELPRAEARALRAAIERPGRATELASRVRTHEARRQLLSHALLASLVDGRRSPLELAYLRRLAAALAVGPAEVTALEQALAVYYARHREFLDAFAGEESASAATSGVLDTLSDRVERNLAAVAQEVRQTGELAELLTKLARGQTLTLQEKKALRRDLVDVVKVVPSLALVASPGGLFLLAALEKLLPFQLLPSAFNDRPPDDPEPPLP